MGLREELGGKLEAALNKLLDEKLTADVLAGARAKLLEEIGELFDKHIGAALVEKLREKLKKDVIDLIDGEDDIK